MKKLFVTLVLALGSMGVIMPTYATPVAQVCDPNSPCLYSGWASSGSSRYYIYVKYGKDGKLVAQIKDSTWTYYVYKDEAQGSYYFNAKGAKYYFNM